MANNSTSVVTHGQCLSKTKSRCFTEIDTGTHDFELTSYPLLEGMGGGNFVCSSTFCVSGHDWNIKFYPDGSRKDLFAWTGVRLCHLSPAKDVRARFTLAVLGKGEQIDGFGVIEHTFSLTSDCWDSPLFVAKSDLKSLLNKNSGFLTIRCTLTVVKEPRTELKRDLLEATQPNLQDHLVQMLKDGEGVDVTFSVGGQLFHAHRCLLAARSPVFKAELVGPMKEKATQSIKVDEIEPQIFKALLHFVYTDSIPDDENSEGGIASLQHLLVAADRYGLDKLRMLCESKLCENMDVETVATTLVLAEQHH
ncbi:hypothetical protein ACQ4PT_054772 [Festuca glaucescens]